MKKYLNRFFRQQANRRILNQDRIFWICKAAIRATDEKKQVSESDTEWRNRHGIRMESSGRIE